MATINGTAGDDTMAAANSADWYFGFGGNDSISGGNGNDTLEGGLGADTLDGGAGIDWASYRNATSGVTAFLFYSPANGGEAFGDVYFNIENLLGSAFSDNLAGDSGNNTIEGGLGADNMNGWGGIDTVSYANATSAIAVDLSTGTGSAGEAAGDSVVDFDNVIGSRFADTIIGTAGDNAIQGRGGADYMDAGAGIDWATYDNVTNATGVTVSLVTGAGTQGEANGDTLIGFENLRGSKNADTLTGDSGVNVIAGGAGADTLDGGAGVDWLSYEFSTGAVTVSLATGLGTQGDANGDVSAGFENLRGGAGNDNLVGDAGNNVIEGKGGRDTLNGAAGFDWASYETATAGVVANMSTTAGTSGDAASDVFVNIEGLRGSAFGDRLVGNANTNFFEGGFGADTFDGAGGEDWVTYRNAANNITAVLQQPVLNVGNEAAGDTYVGIENIEGTAFGDNVQGDPGDNVIAGGEGGDIIGGWGGSDTASFEFATAAVGASLATGGLWGEAAGDQYLQMENLRGSDFSDVLQGDAASNHLDGGIGADTLDGGAGDDWASYTRAGAGVAVSLAAGAGSVGEAAGDSISGIENLRGSVFADTLIGDAGANVLAGGGGADTMDGGAGTDWASYEFATAAVTANLATGVGTGEALGDVYAGIENLRGTSFSDSLTGDAADNILEGRLGGDALNGGAGMDWATYENATTGIVANLAAPSGNSGEALLDTYSSIEGLRGTAFGDTLTGDAFDNWLDGWVGGADTFDGGAGSDWVDYSWAQSAVQVDLTTGGGALGAIGDTFANIENIRGGASGDVLFGNAADNIFEGGAGGDGLFGGFGIDTATYRNAGSGVTVDLQLVTPDGLFPGSGTRGDAAGDAFSGIENLIGSAYDDILFGNTDNNVFTGLAGPDVFGFRDGAGTDTITDFAIAGPGKDTLDVSLVTGITGLSDLTLTQVGADTQIGLAGQGTVVLLNTLTTDLDASHFVF